MKQRELSLKIYKYTACDIAVIMTEDEQVHLIAMAQVGPNWRLRRI